MVYGVNLKDRVFIFKGLILNLIVLAVTALFCFPHWEKLVSLHENGVEREVVVVGMSPMRKGFPHNKLYTVQVGKEEVRIRTLFFVDYELGQSVTAVMDNVVTDNSVMGVKKTSPYGYFFQLPSGLSVALLVVISFVVLSSFIGGLMFSARSSKRP